MFILFYFWRERERERGSILQTSLEGSDEYKDLK